MGAGFSIDIRSNIKEVSKTLSRFQRQAIPKATVSTLNQVAREVNTVAKKELTKAMGFAAKNFKAELTIVKANKNRLVSQVRAKNKAYNLARFNAKQTKKGVRAKAWGKSKVYRGAFIAKAGRTVFARTSDKRLPIKALTGPRLGKEFESSVVNGAMNRKVRERFTPLFNRNIAFHVSKLK
jgi:hypothetical protein